MTTAERLENQNNMKVGIAGIKNVIAGLKESIEEAESKAKRTEEERDQAKHAYQRAYNKQMGLRNKISDIEDELRKREDKIKDTSRRLEEKEQFLDEAKKFNRKLENSTAHAEVVEELEQRLKTTKEIYAKQFECYQLARNRKMDLEMAVEHAEEKRQEAQRQLQKHQMELEYCMQEETRRSAGCKDAIDAAFNTEKDVLTLQRGFDIVIKRKEIAQKKIKSLDEKISKIETSIDTINFDRRRVEATIKELLMQIKEQQKQQ